MGEAGMTEGDGPQLADTRPSDDGARASSRPCTPGGMISERYRLLEQVGAGSTGVVFKADDLAFDRVVAVKVMKGAQGESTAAFLREARTTARLEHPNIIPVHDLIWLNGGGIGFAMQFIDGISLREALQEVASGRPPRCISSVNDAINVFLKVCDCIAMAHDRGVVHCDIKPDNILVGKYGEVIILDWGEALVGESDGKAGPVGTPLYMSPEQARGEPATPSSDVYCIGASLFHCLLGRPPLPSSGIELEDFWERKRRGVVQPPTATEASRCGQRLLAVLNKALATATEARYPTVRALADDLASFQAGQAVSAYRESWYERAVLWYRRNDRAVWLSALLASMAIILAVVLWGSHLQRLASWGSPVFREDFGESWYERWRVPVGTFGVASGQATSLGESAGTMALRREWTPRCAIEFTGEILPGAPRGDISVYWLEGAAAVDGDWFNCRAGWGFLFGAWDNTCSALEKFPTGVIACDRTTVVPGQKHRIRAEVVGDRQRLIVDGRTVFDHQDSFHAGRGRWMIYTWGPGKVISEVTVQLLGVSELVSVTSIPDAMRRRGLLHDAIAEYRIIAESKVGSDLANQAYFKEGITYSELGEWERALQAWNLLGDPVLAEEASVIALKPLIDGDPLRLLTEIEARWPQATTRGRAALFQLWSSASRMFVPFEHRFDDVMIDRYFDLRRRLFPADLTADYTIQSVGKRTGRLSTAVQLILNPCLRGELAIELGDAAWVQAHGTPGTKATLRRHQEETPAVIRQPVDAPLPEWLRAMLSGDGSQVRASLYASGEQGAVIFLDRVFGDPRHTQDQQPIGLAGASCLWQHAIASGDMAVATRWERTIRTRDPNRFQEHSWVHAMLEPTLILAATGRRDEARRLAEAMRAESRFSWKGAAAAWGAALCGEDVAVLPDLVFAQPLLAAMRAELAGEVAAPRLWRAWFDLALPSHSITPMSLLRLAYWRGQAQR